MATATLAGIATIKGLGSASVTYTGVTATLKPLTGGLDHNFNIEELKDGDGNVVALGASNPTEEFQLECYITGLDIATAKTLVKPTPLAVVTIANFPYTEGNGTFNYIGGWSLKMSENVAKVSLKIKRFAGAALTVL